MRAKLSILLLAALLAPRLALADAWAKCTGLPDGSAASQLQSGEAACLSLSSSSTDSELLTITSGLATVCLDPKTTTEGTADAEIRIHRCLGHAVSVNTCTPHLVDVDGDGQVDDVTLNGDALAQRFCQWGLTAGEYFVEIVTAPAGADVGIVQVTGQ